MKLVCLASGRGSNFKAVVEACQSGEIPKSEVVALLCNKPDAPVVQLAKDLKIPVKILKRDAFKKKDGKYDRPAYDKRLAELALPYSPDYVVLAGYLLLLGSAFLHHFPYRVLNIHPSLLPLFPGLNAQRQALLAKAKKTGCTVHLVDASLDGGPILAQAELAIKPKETEETLTERLLELEHKTYVAVLKKLQKSRIIVEGNEARWTPK